MGYRYPVPNEQQSEKLRANGVNPAEFFVKCEAEDGTLYLHNYKTGDEVRVIPNLLKRRT